MAAGADTCARSALSQSREEELSSAFIRLELNSIFLPPLSALYGSFLVHNYSFAGKGREDHGVCMWGGGVSKPLVLPSLLPQHDGRMSVAASITGWGVRMLTLPASTLPTAASTAGVALPIPHVETA